MLKQDASILINRPVEQVFAFLANPENIPQWQSGATESTLISPGALGVGTRFSEVIRIMGRSINVICEITEYEVSRKMGFRSISDAPIQFAGSFTFESQNGSTRLNFAGISSLKGVWRLVEPLMAGEAKRELEGELKTIKGVLEAAA